MINKGVQITRIQTLSDGSIRLVIDIESGDANDFKSAYELKETATKMLLYPVDKEIDVIQAMAVSLLPSENKN